MSENNTTEVTKKDVLKHYLSSLLVYGIILAFVILCPLYNQTVKHPLYNYITFFSIYYVLYAIFAYPIFIKLKPKTVLESRNVKILSYIKRQFTKKDTVQWLESITPDEEEKQAISILFIKTFFGVYCINILFNNYFISMGYNIDFLGEMFNQGVEYSARGGFWGGVGQYINDSADMWIKLIIMVTTTVLAFSYITETELLKNKIKYADTSFLGMASCLLCYYPMIIITNKLFPMYSEEIIPVGDELLKTIINVAAIIACLISMIATIKLGTKSGNLTNRGIITGFPYNIVRHPDYAMQIVYVTTLSIPIYFLPNITFMGKVSLTMGVIFWIYLYYLRAITEERNLIKDEKYVEYINKVPYRFIPKIF